MRSIQIMLLFISSLFLTNPLMAQRPNDHGPRFGQVIEHLEEKLDFSEEQLIALEAVVEDFEASAQALGEQEFENRQARHAAMKELRMGFWAAVKEVLTEEQLAQLGDRRGGESEAHPCDPANFDMEGLRADLESYRTENIKPVLLELRAGLDESISTEDQASIADLRVSFAAFKAQIKTLKEEAHQEGADRQAIHARIKELKEGMKAEHETMRTLLERYRADIKAAFESIAEERTTWDTEQQAIKVTYLGEECANRERHGRRGHGNRGGWEGRGDHHDRGDNHEGRHGRHGRKGHHHKAKKAAHFLLLDPAGDNLTDGNNSRMTPALSLSPNPIYNNTTLTYEVLQDGPITILLQDNKGNVLRKLVAGHKTTGTHNLEVDLSRYRTGSYYFTMNDGTQQVSKTAIITRP